MKDREKHPIHPAVEKIRKILFDREMTHKLGAELIGITPSQLSRVFKGEVQLSLQQLSNFATNIHMDLIDVLTYPEKYIPCDRKPEDTEAILQIKLPKEKKDEIFRIVFGKDVEILDK